MASTQTADRDRAVRLLGVLLAVHLVAHAIHGLPHLAIPVVLAPTLTASVVLFVFVLPVAGFVLLSRGADRLGVAIVTLSMVASLLLAGVLHVVAPNPDHVASIPAGPWRLPFQGTAVLLGVVDAVATVGGVWVWRGLEGERSGTPPRTGRIEGVPDAGFRPLTRLTYWVTRRWFGQVPASLTLTAHNGTILAGLNAYETALERADRVDAGLKELATLKAAMVVGCEFCIDIGTLLATDHGVTERQLRALREFETSDAFTDRERLVLRYAVAMSETPADVPDELFDALAAEFDGAQLVELTASIAFENYRARFNQAFGIDAQGFSEGTFCPRPETDPGAVGDARPETTPSVPGDDR